MWKITKKLTGTLLAFVFLTGCASFRGIDDDVPFYTIGPLHSHETMPDIYLDFSYPRFLIWPISNKLDIEISLKTETPHKKIYVKRLYFEYKGEEYPLLGDVTKTSLSRRLKLGKASNKILRGAFGQFKLGEKDNVLFTIEYSFDDGSLQIAKETYYVKRIEFADFMQS
jgi:hypothetical protein